MYALAWNIGLSINRYVRCWDKWLINNENVFYFCRKVFTEILSSYSFAWVFRSISYYTEVFWCVRKVLPKTYFIVLYFLIEFEKKNHLKTFKYCTERGPNTYKTNNWTQQKNKYSHRYPIVANGVSVIFVMHEHLWLFSMKYWLLDVTFKKKELNNNFHLLILWQWKCLYEELN